MRHTAFLVACLIGCSAAPSVDESPDASTTVAKAVVARPERAALQVLERAFVADPTVGPLLSDARGLVKTGDAIFSAGYADKGVLEDLGVALPARADGPHWVGRGRSARHGVALALVGARAVLPELSAGKTLYAGIYPEVDAVWAAGPRRAELFYVVHALPASSELTFSLSITRGERIVGVKADPSGSVHFADDSGRDVLTMPPPFAVDASGLRRAVTVAVEGDALTLRLDTKGLVAPVVVDPALEAWSWVQKTPYSGGTSAPDARKNAGMAFDASRNKTVLFGGQGGGARCDTWEYAAGAWTNKIVATSSGACPVAGSPIQRINMGMAFDGDKNNVVLFGGYSSPTYLDDTWVYTGGTTWAAACASCVSGTTKPGGRGAPALAYDPARKVVVLFGGYNASGPLCDTWEWNGTSWTMKSDGTSCGTATKPAARSFTSLAYDSARGVTVLFGGQGSATAPFLGDTWEWNGTAWASKSPSTPPSVRRDHVLAYDSYRARVVLFGGVTGNAGGPTAVLNDSYEYNGTAWVDTTTGTAPTTAPKWRWAASGAFDASARRLVVYGGQEASAAGSSTGTLDNDTWEYSSYGGGCTLASQCDTGVCEDGVCCKAACAACQRCDAAGSAGTCTAVTLVEDTVGVTCSGASYCNGAGSCVGKVAKGGACSTAGGGGLMCATGNCYLTGGGVGVCCDTACSGGCQGCTAAETGGANGTCANVTAGGKRTDTTATVALCTSGSATTSCGNDGTCDGAGACRKWASSTVCIAPSCPSATTEKKTSYCDGSGACVATAATACAAGYACVGTACKTSCTGDGDCASTHYCSGGSCVAKKTTGTTCGAANECSSGFCPTQDKVCCDTACSGTCEACTGAKKGSGSDGTCGAVADGGDPDSECPEPPAYACASATGMGVCDGAKKCRAFAKSGTACAAGTTCTAGEQTGKACDGAGNCIAGTVTKCNPYKCDLAGVVCLAKCTLDSDCADAKLFFCDKLGLCQPRKALGSDCGDTNECGVGASCADKVCCDTTCTGQCESCVEAATKGTCTAVSGDPRPGHAACTGDKASGCAGTCDGKNRAACFYDVGKECDAKCAANKAVVSKCDGTGACKAEPEAACNGYKCTADGKRCGSSCATDADCESTYRCDATKCVPKGAKCSADENGVDDGTKVTPCNPYKCRGAKCLESCTTSNDCVSPTICDGNKCVEPTTTPTVVDDSGCGCAVPGRSPRTDVGVGLLVGLVALVGRRRRR